MQVIRTGTRPISRARPGLNPWISMLLALTLALMLAGCGGNDHAPATEGQATIGQAGGSVNGPDGTLITIPAGALAADTTVRIARDGTGAPVLPDSWVAVSAVYTITPHIEHFDLPVALNLPFDPATLAADQEVLIAVAKPGGEWEALPATRTGNAALASTTHFSHVVVVRRQPWFEATLTGPVPLPHWPANTTANIFEIVAPMTLDLQFTMRVDPAYTNCSAFDYQYEVRQWSRTAGGVWSDTNVVQRGTRHVDYTTVSLVNGQLIEHYPIPVDASLNGLIELVLAAHCTQRYRPSGAIQIDGGWSDVAVVRIDIPAATGTPVITQQPQSITVTAGQAATFSVAATVSNTLAVTWERSTDGGATWAALTSGGNVLAAGANLTLNGTVLGDSGSMVRAQVCNAQVLGAPVCLASAPATLTVVAANAAPTYLQQPASVSVASGQTASFAVAVTGTPAASVQWMRGTPASATPVGTPCAGSGTQTACSYTTPILAVADSGTTFFARAVNVAGTVDSQLATVTVTTSAIAPTIPAAEPADVTVAPGNPATFAVNASGTAPLSYQWQREGVAITGANSSSYTLGSVAASDDGAHFGVVVGNGSGETTSRTATLTVTSPTGMTCTGNGGTGWCRQETGMPYLQHAAFGSGTLGLAVSYAGDLMRTTDGGMTWSYATTAFLGTVAFNDVAFADANTAIVVGADFASTDNVIYRSTDGGLQWTQVYQAPYANLSSGLTEVRFANAQLGLVPAGRSFLRTTDGGTTWTKIDHGLTFSDGTTAYDRAARSVAFLDASTVVAVSSVNGLANSAAMLRSSDAGLTWTTGAALTGFTQYLRGLSFANASTGLGTIGAGGGFPPLLARTTDGGLTWTTLQVDATQPVSYFESVRLNSDGTAVAVAGGGIIARSSDAGATWQWATSGTTKPLYCVTSPSTGVFVVVGGQIVLRNAQSGI